jgi:hypothetical protein
MRHTECSTPATRKARIADVVAQAKANGEKIPPGVARLGVAPLSPAAQAHAATLAPLARRALSRLHRTAA